MKKSLDEPCLESKLILSKTPDQRDDDWLGGKAAGE